MAGVVWLRGLGREHLAVPERDAAVGQLLLEPGPLAHRVAEVCRRGRDPVCLAEPDEGAVVAELPGQGFRNGSRPIRRSKPGPGLHEVGQQKVVRPVPFLTFAKGPL